MMSFRVLQQVPLIYLLVYVSGIYLILCSVLKMIFCELSMLNALTRKKCYWNHFIKQLIVHTVIWKSIACYSGKNAVVGVRKPDLKFELRLLLTV